MAGMALAAETFDVTARKFHQWISIGLLALGFVVGPPGDAWLVALIGLVFLLGRFWWPADIFRQLVWRVLEPAGLLTRREAVEDHGTRRLARTIGGVALIAAALAIAGGQSIGWIVVALMAVMVGLDAAFDHCLLCWANFQIGRLRRT